MIQSLLLFGWVSAVALALLLILAWLFRWKHRGSVLPLQGSYGTDVPYVRVDIQGHPLNLVVDTAAAASFIRRDVLSALLDTQGFLYSDTGKSYTPIGVEGTLSSMPVWLLPFSDSDNAAAEEFIVYDSPIANFSELCNVEIHGILGSPFLVNYDCDIDFLSHTLTIRK